MIRYAWDRNRRKLYAVPTGGSGEPPPGDPTDPPKPSDPSGGGDGGDPKTFTQEDLNRIAAREKEQGKQAATRELSEQLGVSLDEAKSIIQQAKDREESEKSDAQKARDAADREKAAAEAEKSAAAADRHAVAVERAIMLAGVTDEKKLARVTRMVTVETGASREDIQADVDQLKEDFPELFTAKEEGDPTPPRRTPSSDPPGKPPADRKNEDAYSKGAERAKAYGGTGVTYGDA